MKKINTLFRDQYIEKEVHSFFKKDGIELNLNGINQMVYEYNNSDDLDLESLKRVVKDLILWINYLGDLKILLEQKQREYALNSDISLSKIEEKDSNAQIKADTSKTYKYRNKLLGLYIYNIEKAISLFKIARYHSSQELNRSMYNYNYAKQYH